MSARNSLNLRRWGKEWGGPLNMARRWKIECFEFTTERSYWTAIADVKRKRVPNSRGSYRKTSRAKTCTDTRHRQQISVRWSWIGCAGRQSCWPERPPSTPAILYGCCVRHIRGACKTWLNSGMLWYLAGRDVIKYVYSVTKQCALNITFCAILPIFCALSVHACKIAVI